MAFEAFDDDFGFTPEDFRLTRELATNVEIPQNFFAFEPTDTAVPTLQGFSPGQDSIDFNSMTDAQFNKFLGQGDEGLFVDTGTGQLVNAAGSPFSQAQIDAMAASVEEQVRSGQAPPGILDALNKFLGTNLGKIAGSLALGGAGLGLARAVTGGGQTFTPPASQPALPAVQSARDALNQILTGGGTTSAQDLQSLIRQSIAGQRTIADLSSARAGRELAMDTQQAPLEQAIRMQALGELPSYLSGGTPSIATTAPTAAMGFTPLTINGTAIPNWYIGPNGQPMLFNQQTGMLQPAQAGALPSSSLTPMNDPIQEALANEVLKASRGETSDPLLERTLAQQARDLETRLFRQVGPGYATSTPGSQALAEQNAMDAIARSQNRRQTITSLAPLEAQRRQFNLTFPESVRTTGFNERTNLTTLGRTNPAAAFTTLSQMVPIAPLFGLSDAAATTRQNEAIQNQFALDAFKAGQTEQSRLAEAITKLFGTAAGAGFGGSS